MSGYFRKSKTLGENAKTELDFSNYETKKKINTQQL